ncbi:sigma-70 family RNA polymerase sigma factor [Streptomyces sp. NPDC013178]|uniref:sigma-70 family RNA polymerase sigma factor n=1 Tax=Streptomyces sp. NPDC013178 TaxID=3155118 RepID=UPI0033E69440
MNETPTLMESATSSPPDTLNSVGAEFMRLRPRLFGVAYRVLGDLAEAEDIVQEVWVRWQNADRTQVRAVTAFLVRTTVHLAINVTQSARARREVVGGFPQQLVHDVAGPGESAERMDLVSHAMQMLLQRLSPVERAAFVLREAFEYEYSEIALLLDLSQPNARQVVSRARKRLHTGAEGAVDVREHRRLLSAFVAASRSGEVAAIEGLLTADSRRPRPKTGTKVQAEPSLERRTPPGAGQPLRDSSGTGGAGRSSVDLRQAAAVTRHAGIPARAGARAEGRSTSPALGSSTGAAPRAHTFEATVRCHGKRLPNLSGPRLREVVQADRTTVHVLLADLSGSPGSAAVLGAPLREAWRTAVLAGETQAEQMRRMEAALSTGRQVGDACATVLLLRFCAGDREVRAMSAGHSGFLLRRAHTVRWIEPAPGTALGTPSALSSRQQIRLPLAPADRVVAFTNGLFGQRAGSATAADVDGLLRLARQHQGLGAQDFVDILFDDARDKAAAQRGLAPDAAILHLGWRDTDNRSVGT